MEILTMFKTLTIKIYELKNKNVLDILWLTLDFSIKGKKKREKRIIWNIPHKYHLTLKNPLEKKTYYYFNLKDKKKE